MSPRSSLLATVAALSLFPSLVAAAACNADALAGAEARLAAALSEHRIPGLYAGIVDGDRIHHIALGDAGRGRKVTDQTIFPTASAGKTFTAALLAQAAVDGKLDIDAELAGFMKAPATDEPLRLRHLVTHTSGLTMNAFFAAFSEIYGPQGGDPTPDMLVHLLPMVEPAGAPGAAFDYSNGNYALLGQVVQQAYGKPFPIAAMVDLFGRHGLTDTTVRPTYEQWDRMAVGHNGRSGAPELEWWSLPHPRGIVADGGFYTSGADAAKWVQMQMGHTAPDFAPVATRMQEILFEGDGMDVAWAWQVIDAGDGTPVFNHRGGMPGYATLFAFAPDKQCGLAFLSNLGKHEATVVATELMKDLAR